MPDYTCDDCNTKLKYVAHVASPGIGIDYKCPNCQTDYRAMRHGSCNKIEDINPEDMCPGIEYYK